MPLSHYLCCLWPGLPELWFRGRSSALPVAIGFAWVLNTLLVARYIYPEWLEPMAVKTFFWGFVVVWAVLFFRTARRLPAFLAPRHVAGVEDCYEAASAEFLKGHWFEAEALLVQCLTVDARDALSLLLLAGVYRHTQRYAAAQQTLDELATLETGEAWWLERDIEQRRLDRLLDQADAETGEETGNEDEVAKASSSQVKKVRTKESAEMAEL